MPFELRINLYDQKRSPCIDQRADIRRSLQIGDALEHAGTVQPREQLARRRSVILVQSRIGHVIKVVSGGVTENQRLHHRRNEKTEARAPIFQYRKKLLASQSDNSQQGVEHATHCSVLRMAKRLASASSATMAASTRLFGTITDQTLPARNTVCNSAT